MGSFAFQDDMADHVGDAFVVVMIGDVVGVFPVVVLVGVMITQVLVSLKK